jgi:hypothetical protein
MLAATPASLRVMMGGEERAAICFVFIRTEGAWRVLIVAVVCI